MKVTQSRLLSLAVLACAFISGVDAKPSERRGFFEFGKRQDSTTTSIVTVTPSDCPATAFTTTTVTSDVHDAMASAEPAWPRYVGNYMLGRKLGSGVSGTYWVYTRLK